MKYLSHAWKVGYSTKEPIVFIFDVDTEDVVGAFSLDAIRRLIGGLTEVANECDQLHGKTHERNHDA